MTYFQGDLMDLKETLTLFITRMAMYIHPINKETIVAFIHGYEVGLGHQTFTEVLSNHLETEFRIKKIALGWPYQIEVYASKNTLEWDQAFNKLTLELIEHKKI